MFYRPVDIGHNYAIVMHISNSDCLNDADNEDNWDFDTVCLTVLDFSTGQVERIAVKTNGVAVPPPEP